MGIVKNAFKDIMWDGTKYHKATPEAAAPVSGTAATDPSAIASMDSDHETQDELSEGDADHRPDGENTSLPKTIATATNSTSFERGAAVARSMAALPKICAPQRLQEKRQCRRNRSKQRRKAFIKRVGSRKRRPASKPSETKNSPLLSEVQKDRYHNIMQEVKNQCRSLLTVSVIDDSIEL